jgi:hypothetical protein
MERIQIPGDGLIVTPKGGNHVMTVKGYAGNSLGDGIKPSNNKSKDENLDHTVDWVRWGNNDRYPQEVLEKNAPVGVILRGIEINTELHFGNGILFYTKKYEEGQISRTITEPAWWPSLSRMLNFDNLQAEVIESLNTMAIAFVEVILDKNSPRKVAAAQVLDFCHTRYAKRNKSGEITHVYYHADIGSKDNNEPNTKEVAKIPLFNPRWKKEDYPDKFVIDMQFRTFNRNYYPEPNYTASHTNGWSNVAAQIPKLISSIYENQMMVKYHVVVDIGYFRIKYSCWDNPPEADTEEKKMAWQLEKIEEFSAQMNEHLTKPDNAGKAIVTIRDEMEKMGVEIKPIQNFLDSTKELPNAAAANSEMLFVDGVDPALVGQGIPGGKNLSGSGSDKREAAKFKQQTMRLPRAKSLEWIYKIAMHIYAMPDDMHIAYIDIDSSQTLDENPTGKQQITAG